jgi:hypothetical protein
VSTDYVEYKDSVNGEDTLTISTGTGGIKLTLSWGFQRHPAAKETPNIRKFWISNEDAEDLAMWLTYLTQEPAGVRDASKKST